MVVIICWEGQMERGHTWDRKDRSVRLLSSGTSTLSCKSFNPIMTYSQYCWAANIFDRVLESQIILELRHLVNQCLVNKF